MSRLRARGDGGPPQEIAALWPASAEVRWRRSCGAGERGLLAVPSRRNLRMLVPTGVADADRMLVRYAGNTATRAARATWRRALATGLATRLPVARLCIADHESGIERYLADHLHRTLRIGVLLGPPRANRKPVLQLFDGEGRTFAFAKLGSTSLTADLVTNEAAALQFLDRHRTSTFKAPRLLHVGTWGGMPVIVQEALDQAQTSGDSPSPPFTVMAEIAGLNGFRDEGPACGTVLDALPDGGTTSLPYIAPFERLRSVLGAAPPSPVGSWHGDFAPWNLATAASVTHVWDWERFSTSAPVGSDAAHYRMQLALRAGVSPPVAWDAACSDVGAVLKASAREPEHAPVVTGTYLLAVCRRYLHDADGRPPPQLGRRLTWLAQVAEYASRQLGSDQR